MSTRVRVTLAFDGSAYNGWQVQRIGTGVQQKVEEALASIFPSKPTVHGSSRTDTGVHAVGMVAHFDTAPDELRMAPRKLILALNAHLPPDIRISAASMAPPTFHARFDAISKEYRYTIWNAPALNPLLRSCAWHVPRTLDLPAMRRAAQTLVGRRDFRAFSTNPGYERLSTIRNLHVLRIRKAGPLLTFILKADGFLYRMCRGIVGTLVDIGLHKLTDANLVDALQQKSRPLAGVCAPPHGLVLWHVTYPPDHGL